MAAVTKNSAEHENDNISITTEWILTKLCRNDSCMKLIQNLIRVDLSSFHPYLKIAKYGRWWAIKTISQEGVIWVDVQVSHGNFAT